VNPAVVEYAVQTMIKRGLAPSAAAKDTVKRLGTTTTNVFLGPGVTVIDTGALEAALWDRLAEFAAKGATSFKSGKEHFALGGTIQYFHQKPTIRARLKEAVIAKLGRDPFTADDGS
jgi:hypothetical protein